MPHRQQDDVANSNQLVVTERPESPWSKMMSPLATVIGAAMLSGVVAIFTVRGKVDAHDKAIADLAANVAKDTTLLKERTDKLESRTEKFLELGARVEATLQAMSSDLTKLGAQISSVSGDRYTATQAMSYQAATNARLEAQAQSISEMRTIIATLAESTRRLDQIESLLRSVQFGAAPKP